MAVRYASIPQFPGYRVGTDGSVWSRRLQLKPSKARNGYLTVSLYCGAKNTRETRYVHRLVLEAFVGPCPDGMECRHLNDVRTDNRAENLRWGTRAENVNDWAVIHNKSPQGERNYFAKLTRDDVAEIRNRLAIGVKRSLLAREFGVGVGTIGYIARGDTWATKDSPIAEAQPSLFEGDRSDA